MPRHPYRPIVTRRAADESTLRVLNKLISHLSSSFMLTMMIKIHHQSHQETLSCNANHCLLSFFSSPALSASAVEFLAYVNGGLLLFLTHQLIRDRKDLRVVIRALLLGSFAPLLFSAIGIIGTFLGELIPGIMSVSGKLTATFMFSNQLPSYMVILLPLLIHTGITLRGRIWTRAIAWCGAVLAMGALLTSGSRSGFLAGLVAAIGYLFWISSTIKRGIIVLLFLFLCLPFFLMWWVLRVVMWLVFISWE